MTPKQLQDFFYTEWGICGCGRPGEQAELLLDVLRCLAERDDPRSTAETWNASGRKIDALLGDKATLTEEERKAMVRSVYFFLYQLDRTELTEHGGGVGGCWLTGKGRSVLAALEAYGVYPDTWEVLSEGDGDGL